MTPTPPSGEAAEIVCPECGLGFCPVCKGDMVTGHLMDCKNRRSPAPTPEGANGVAAAEERIARDLYWTFGSGRWKDLSEGQKAAWYTAARATTAALSAPNQRSGEGDK